MMACAPASRRQLFLAAGGAALSGACGRARRRRPGRLPIFSVRGGYPRPAKSPGGSEVWIMSALFEPLLQPHPETATPIAGLATHYSVDGTARGTRSTCAGIRRRKG